MPLSESVTRQSPRPSDDGRDLLLGYESYLAAIVPSE